MQQKTIIKKVVRKPLQKKIIDLPVKEIARRMINILKNHVGEKRRISMLEMIHAIYGFSLQSVNPMQRSTMLFRCNQARNMVRRRSRCQVVSKSYELANGITMFYYFVASKQEETYSYRNQIKACQEAMDRAVSRMNQSIEEGWYRHPEQWTLEAENSADDVEFTDSPIEPPIPPEQYPIFSFKRKKSSLINR